MEGRHRAQFVVLAAILLAAAGCTVVNVPRFRVVDAVDGHPIEGVRAVGKTRWPGFSAPDVDDAASDASGLVEFHTLGEQEVTLQKAGYESCEVVAAWKGYRPRNLFQRMHVYDWEDDHKTAVITMQPITQKGSEENRAAQ